jgi:hypothetical protein
MGVLAHRLRTLDGCSSPHRNERKFSAHVSAESHLNSSPNPSEVISLVLEPLDKISKYPPFPPKNHIVRGLGGVPEFFLVWNPNIFVT